MRFLSPAFLQYHWSFQCLVFRSGISTRFIFFVCVNKIYKVDFSCRVNRFFFYKPYLLLFYTQWCSHPWRHCRRRSSSIWWPPPRLADWTTSVLIFRAPPLKPLRPRPSSLAVIPAPRRLSRSPDPNRGEAAGRSWSSASLFLNHRQRRSSTTWS